MTRTINNIDKNFHESFSAKGFRYLNAVGDTAPPPPVKVDSGTIPVGPCPAGKEWVAGMCRPKKKIILPGGPPPTDGPVDTGAPPVSYPAAGTLLGTYCAGVDKMGKYADGAGGFTTAVFERNSPSCGYVTPVPTPIPVPVPVPVPTPTPLPSVPSDSTPSGPVYPSIPGGGGGASGGGAGYEEPAEYMEEVAVLPAEEINWPAIAIAGAVVGLTYWYMGKEKAAA